MTTASVRLPTPTVVARRIVIEAMLLAIAWQLYRWGRFLVRDQEAQAMDNAGQVVEIERSLLIAVEPTIQDAAMVSKDMIGFLNHYYVYTHVAATLLCLVWLFLRHPHHYRRFRRVLVAATGLGLVVHGLYPLAPPRMLRDLQMIDTLAVYGPGVYSHDEFASITNQFAAMPSFHVGWSALIACFVIQCCRSRWRWVALAHPMLMSIAVVATANHYLLDGIVGTAMVLGGVALDRWWQDRARRTDQRSRAVPLASPSQPQPSAA